MAESSSSMKSVEAVRIAIVAGLLLMLSVNRIHAQQLAEGTYGAPHAETTHLSFHWVMSKTSADELVVRTSPEGGQSERDRMESFGMTRDFKPRFYSAKSTKSGLAGEIRCDYGKDAISCQFNRKGIQRQSASARIVGPSVFVLPVLLDADWAIAMLCSQAERVPGKVTEISAVSLANTSQSDGLKLSQEKIPVTYIGEDAIDLPFGHFPALKFQVAGNIIWTAKSNLVLAMAQKDSSNEHKIELLTFKQKSNVSLLIAP